MAGRRRLLRDLDLRTVRRRSSMLADEVAATGWKRIRRPPTAPPFDGDPRLALITVNFSTTRYLKMLLLTLSQQEHLGLLHRIVIVDNASLDGGAELVDRLAARIPRLQAVHRRHWLGHGPGLRAGIRALDAADSTEDRPVNAVVFCDTDVVFRSPSVLMALAGVLIEHRPALIGEVRSGTNEAPDIQASFLVVRRDVLRRRDIAPPVHHGSPTYPLQRSVAAAGLTIVDLPTYRNGLLLHRGRAGVAAATQYRPHHQHAGLANDRPHYMGVPRGAEIWREIEHGHAELLDPGSEDLLTDLLAQRFSVLGTAVLED